MVCTVPSHQLMDEVPAILGSLVTKHSALMVLDPVVMQKILKVVSRTAQLFTRNAELGIARLAAIFAARSVLEI